MNVQDTKNHEDDEMMVNTELELARPNDVQRSNAMLQYISLIASSYPGSSGSEQYFRFTIGAVEYSGSFNIRWKKKPSLKPRKNQEVEE